MFRFAEKSQLFRFVFWAYAIGTVTMFRLFRFEIANRGSWAKLSHRGIGGATRFDFGGVASVGLKDGRGFVAFYIRSGV